MSIQTECPGCGKSNPTSADSVGRAVRCPHCGSDWILGQGDHPPAPAPVQLPQDLLAWARQQVNEEETVAGLREIRETGGLELDDFIRELEQDATPRE